MLRTTAEHIVEFDYRPGKCTKDYRVVALRKNISVERGEAVLFDQYRYFFYITNDRALTADEVVAEARQRCNQENLISQLKGGMRALHAPVNTLNANWAYTARVNLSEADSLGNHCVVAVSSFGSLIHTAAGSAGGSGSLRTNRSGCSA